MMVFNGSYLHFNVLTNNFFNIFPKFFPKWYISSISVSSVWTQTVCACVYMYECVCVFGNWAFAKVPLLWIIFFASIFLELCGLCFTSLSFPFLPSLPCFTDLQVSADPLGGAQREAKEMVLETGRRIWTFQKGWGARAFQLSEEHKRGTGKGAAAPTRAAGSWGAERLGWGQGLKGRGQNGEASHFRLWICVLFYRQQSRSRSY